MRNNLKSKNNTVFVECFIQSHLSGKLEDKRTNIDSKLIPSYGTYSQSQVKY